MTFNMLDMVCELHPELCKIFDDAGIPVINMETLNTFFGEYNLACNSIMDGSTIKPGPVLSTIDDYPTPTTIKPGPVPSTIHDYPTPTTIKPEPMPSTIDEYPTPTTIKTGPVPTTIDDYPTISKTGQTCQFNKCFINENEYISFLYFR